MCLISSGASSPLQQRRQPGGPQCNPPQLAAKSARRRLDPPDPGDEGKSPVNARNADVYDTVTLIVERPQPGCERHRQAFQSMAVKWRLSPFKSMPNSASDSAPQQMSVRRMMGRSRPGGIMIKSMAGRACITDGPWCDLRIRAVSDTHRRERLTGRLEVVNATRNFLETWRTSFCW